MVLLHNKIKAARLKVGLTQVVIEDKHGIAQETISRIETGKTKTVPTDYFQLLYDNGIDLNSLFNRSVSEPSLQRNIEDQNDSDGMVRLTEIIEEKDKEIIKLNGKIEALYEVIHGKGSSKVKSA